MALSEGVQSRLKALADLFAGELPERVHEIAVAAEAAQAGNDVEAYRELRMRSHKLAGSAATFGFVTITSSARQIEHIVDQKLAAERTLDRSEHAELTRLVAELSSHVDPAAESGVDSAEANRFPQSADNAGAEAQGEKSVLAYVSDETFNALQEPLGVFGLTIARREIPEKLGEDAGEAVAALVELPSGTSGLLTMAELQSAGASDRLPLYVLAPEDSTKLRLQVTRVPHAIYFPAPYPIETIAEDIHERVESPEGGPSAAVVAGKPGPVLERVCSVVREAGVSVCAVDTIESMMSEVVFMQPDTVVLVDDLNDARRGDACRSLRQDASLPTARILYVGNPAADIPVSQAFAEGADQMVAFEDLDSLRVFLAQRRRFERSRENKLFRWVLAEVARAQRLGRELSLVMFQIDQLPELRRNHQGFAVHRAVRTLSSLLAERLRHSDSLFKNADLGFTAVLFDAGCEVAADVSNEIVYSFEKRIADETPRLSLSVGVASFPEFDGPLPLLDAAGRAVERAKGYEGNRTKIEHK